MGRLAIRKVQYSGDRYSFSSPRLPDGLVIVEGDNGCGKSTFADLVFFALGGNVTQFKKNGREQHKEIRSDSNNFVRIEIEVSGEEYALTRRFDASQDVLLASLSSAEGAPDVEVLPVVRRDERRVISDWLLDKLGIRPVTLFTGAYHGKLNFTDLMRLMYHDQDPNPAHVFMRLEHSGFVTDSRDFRRAIFEILVGSSFERYYEMLGKLRLAEKIFGERAAALAVYKGAVSQMARGRQDANDIFLRSQIQEKESQLERLQLSRSSLRKTAPMAASPESELIMLRRRLTEVELEIDSFEQAQRTLTAELIRFDMLKGQLIDEVVRIQKIIHAHETLSLFSPDTCPCCLRRVDRAKGHCICSQEVEESAYQRFFYSSDEYLKILKSKQKNVQTVLEAKEACDEEMARNVRGLNKARDRAAAIRKKMEGWAGTNDVYGTKLERVDDEIVEVRVELERLRQQLDMELERNKLQAAEEAARVEVERLRSEVQRLELDAQKDRLQKVASFDSIYSRLMRETLQNVRTARLDPDYEPILDEGDYREASATVTRRLMYFLTLLELSLKQSVPFPRFLLIDTPETAGIDRENLSRAIGKIPDVLSLGDAQVILTTGPDRYPAALRRCRLVRLTEDSKLLTLKEDLWSTWQFQDEDITSEIGDAINDDLVQAVTDGDYPAGYTEIEDLVFRKKNDETGTADFHASFAAEHHSEEGLGFAGHVDGQLEFDPSAETKEDLLATIKVISARAHFDIE